MLPHDPKPTAVCCRERSGANDQERGRSSGGEVNSSAEQELFRVHVCWFFPFQHFSTLGRMHDGADDCFGQGMRVQWECSWLELAVGDSFEFCALCERLRERHCEEEQATYQS